MPIPVCTTTSKPETIVELLDEHGIVSLPAWLGADDVAAVTVEADQLLADEPENAEVLGYSLGKGVRVERSQLDAGYTALHRCFTEEWMREVAAGFFGHQPFAFNHDVIVVRDVVGTEHAARNPHYDRTPNLKFFLYLVDTTQRNGAFCCRPGSQRYGKQAQAENRAVGRLPTQSDTRILPPDLTTGLEPVEGVAGTLMVIDSDIVHLGSPVLDGYRLAVRSRCYDPTLE